MHHKYDIDTELGYVMMDLKNIKSYVELIMTDYSKVIDRLSCIRLRLDLEKRKGSV
jgi:hypothetical protein